jgi:hypothetical protein
VAISVAWKADEERLIREYADFKGITITELIKQAVFDSIEDYYDAVDLAQAIEENDGAPGRPWKEVKQELGL